MQSYLYHLLCGYDIRKLPYAIRFLILQFMNKAFLSICLLWSLGSYAQIIKGDSIRSIQLRKHIEFLANDKLEGRRTGSKGERLAYEYLVKQFKNNGIEPVGEYNNYLQPFPVNDGKSITKAKLYINNSLLPDSLFFPMGWSGNAKLNSTSEEIALFNIAPLISVNSTNPHFELLQFVYDSVKTIEASGKKAVILINTSVSSDIHFEPKTKFTALTIPVIYLKSFGTEISTKPFRIKLIVQIKEASRIGHNVIGFINNHSSATVIVGAHYDHLGYGEDHGSLYTGSIPMIHNGADDNASGTSALILLSSMLKSSGFNNNNYILIAFSGEELGLFGSKYFTEHLPFLPDKINYMINMDMVGRLNESTHSITIGGYGTSPEWKQLIQQKQNYFNIKIDSSGSGPSDHTSFYRKNIPVLFFFTGTHHDYHKPSDDADKINYTGELKVIDFIYDIIGIADKTGKLLFTKTKDAATSGISSLKVTLGIMPDYTFSGSGVMVDGVSDGRPAQKAGIIAGDILYKLGDHSFQDVQTYMQVLNKFEKGNSTKVYLKRAGKELVLDIKL